MERSAGSPAYKRFGEAKTLESGKFTLPDSSEIKGAPAGAQRSGSGGVELHLGGQRFRLETAAVSALRYRAAYGDSVVNHLAACTGWKKAEGVLLRMVHAMIPPEERPSLLELASLARRSGGFLAQGLRARDALLASDPWAPAGEPGAEPFDEYGVLALLAAAGVDAGLIYELPVLHLAGVAARTFALKKGPPPDCRRPMSPEGRAMLYPRPGKRRN